MQPSYLDHAATTPLDPDVLTEMLPYLGEHFGNPSSPHRLGVKAREALDRARERVADVLGVSRQELVFTGSGSEAINLALKGAAQARRARARHVITTAVEHHATLKAAEALRAQGFELTVLPVDETGRVEAAAVERALRPDTALVSVMYANNEVGTVQPIEEIGALCQARGVLFHVDAVQAVGALPLQLDALPVDLLSASAHKFYGPKGVGLLFVRRGTEMTGQIDGGPQEQKLRAGTENVAGAVGLAAALERAVSQRASSAAHCVALRDHLSAGILEAVPRVRLNGHPTERLPGHVHVSFEGLEGAKSTETLLAELDAAGICCSSGSACNSTALEPSHVLTAMGLSRELAFGSIRFTLGRGNTLDEMNRVLALLPPLVARLRKLSAPQAASARRSA